MHILYDKKHKITLMELIYSYSTINLFKISYYLQVKRNMIKAVMLLLYNIYYYKIKIVTISAFSFTLTLNYYFCMFQMLFLLAMIILITSC